MNTINSIIIEGNLVRDPVLKKTANGTPVCNFSLATNREYRYNNEDVKETSFFDIETWADTALRCSSAGAKGRRARVVGRLKQDRWTGADGKSYSRIKVIADDVSFKPASNYHASAQSNADDPKNGAAAVAEPMSADSSAASAMKEAAY